MILLNDNITGFIYLKPICIGFKYMKPVILSFRRIIRVLIMKDQVLKTNASLGLYVENSQEA